MPVSSQLSISCWWRGDSLSLFKDPIHSDLLKVLMLILLSLQASGNGGEEAVGRSWATLFCSPIIQAPSSPKLLHVTAWLPFTWPPLNNFHILTHRNLHGFRAFITSSHKAYESIVFLCAYLIYCSEWSHLSVLVKLRYQTMVSHLTRISR